jgi:glycosyltransferase involved in cell wall biosynthesis
MRITLIGDKLDCGGIQRVITNIANYWAQQDCQVTMIILDDGSTPPFFELDSRVRLIPLGLLRTSSSFMTVACKNLKRIYMLRSAMRKSNPDVVVSHWTFVNVLVLFASRGLGVPVVVTEHGDLFRPLGRAFRLLVRWAYSFSDHVVVLTERVKIDFQRNVRAKTTVIPNSVSVVTPPITTLPAPQAPKPLIVAIGRLSRQKGFDLLLRAFHQLRDRHPHWSLTILGDGPLHKEIESLRDELGLQDQVLITGTVRDPYSVLRQADLFVLSSRWEGFPNVLLEAMSCGLPVISADCRTGPREIIRDGVDGLLVEPENVGALATAMDRLMSDESERDSLASRAAEITERYSLNQVMGMWEELLSAMVS